MSKGQRSKRKATVKELEGMLEQMATAHNALVEMVMGLGRHFESLSTLLHCVMVDTGHALKAKCSACDTEVVYPAMDEFKSFPVCPNAETKEECKDGFSHIENPFDDDTVQMTVDDYGENTDADDEEE